MVSIVTTAFILYAVKGAWKIGASIADALMNTSEVDTP
jgi:hypothetical protein